MLGFMMAGLMTVVCILMMMARTDLLKWLGYSNVVDVAFTVIMIILFHDTFSGVVSASFAGVFMSGMLWTLRSVLGYKKLRIHRLKPVWVYYPAKWRQEHVGQKADSFAFEGSTQAA
jgi:xanthine/uracil permease